MNSLSKEVKFTACFNVFVEIQYKKSHSDKKTDFIHASGSACNSGAIEASHVLRAMGIEGDRLYGAVRIGFGRYTTETEIVAAGRLIAEEVQRLRKLALE